MHCNIIETSLTDEWQPRMSTPSPSTTPRSTRTATSRSSLTRGSLSSTPEIRKRESSIPPFSTRSTEKTRSPHFPKSSDRCGRGTDILALNHVSRVIRYCWDVLKVSTVSLSIQFAGVASPPVLCSNFVLKMRNKK